MRLVYLALGWTAGIVLAANTDARPTLIWLALAALAALAWWLARDVPGQRWALAALMAFTLGGLRFSAVPVSSDVAQYNGGSGLTIEGMVVAEPDVRDDRVQLRVAVETVNLGGPIFASSGLVLVEAPRLAEVRYGDRIAATGLLVTPAEFDTFSYADFLARGGIFSIMPNAAVSTLTSGQGSPLYSALLDFKAWALTIIGQNLPEPQAGLLSGILLGSERGIAPEVRDAFTAVGASHIVAISGFNMVILSGVVMGLLRRARVPDRWAVLIGIGVILLYTVLVGANAAVVRAALMSSLLVIGGVIRRRTYVPASLALLVIVMSVINPTVLWDVGFQLSLFAVIGLTLFTAPLGRGLDVLLARLFPRRVAGAIAGFLAEPLVVTLAVQITTLPLIVLHFGRLSPVTVIVNLLVVPPQAALLVLGLSALLMALFVPVVAQLLFWFDLILLSWTVDVVRLFARLPFADMAFNVDPRLITTYFVILIGGALMQATQPTWALRLAQWIRRRLVVMAMACAGGGIAILIGAVFLSRPDGRLHVWFLDVGHSNAVLVETPGGAHILVDGGRFPSRLLTALGDRMPFTDRTIEVLVMTEPDEADIGALAAVLQRYDVGLVLTNGQTVLSESFLGLDALLARREALTVRAGYSLDVDDGVRLQVLHPQRQPQPGDSLDDNALTLRLEYGEVSFLLTSDLSQTGQRALLQAGAWPLATVLQLPQHGAVRSLAEAFLEAVQPQAIVLQSDRTNRRGDPDADTLALLGEQPVFRTDQGGAIHMWTDGQSLWVAQNR